MEIEWECDNERESRGDHDDYCSHSHDPEGYCETCQGWGNHCTAPNCIARSVYENRQNCDLRRTSLQWGQPQEYCQRCFVPEDECEEGSDYDDDSCVAYPDRSGQPMEAYVDSDRRLAPLPQDWEVKPDGSVEHGFECCTPILSFEEWPADKLHAALSRIFSGMRRHGCDAAPSCGTHIHVSQPLYQTAYEKRKWQRRLVLSVANNEDILYELAIGDHDMHRGTGYCFPVSDAKLRVAHDGIGLETLAVGNHYDGVSLNSHWPTIEWRIFNSTLNSSVAVAWVVLCRQFMRYTLDNPPLPPLQSCEHLLSTIGVEAGELRYFQEFYDFGDDKSKTHIDPRSTVVSRVKLGSGSLFGFDKRLGRVSSSPIVRARPRR